MATIVVTNMTKCAGGAHVVISATVDGNAVTRVYPRSELVDVKDAADIETRVLLRLYSAVLESGASTDLQIRNALVGKEFKV